MLGLLSFHGLSEKGSAFTLLRSKGTLSVYKASPVSFCLPAPLSVSLAFFPGAGDWDPRCWAALGQGWLQRSSAL